MSAPRRWLPLDFGDYALHVIATFAIAAAAAEAARTNEAGAIGFVVAVSAVLLTVRRNLARRALSADGLSSGEFTAERLAQLEQRVADLDDAQLRMHELEERLEFAERLLARPESQPTEVRR